jgi:bifunctional UDP-N-acetylglucosamine pyrophosphorylase/glucosamine-1-phosphate N-acetyltransferase
MKTNVTVVILAAGLGTRMKSGRAKVLHQAGGDTLLNHVIRAALHVADPEHIVAVVGHQADEVRHSVKFPGVRFALQSEQKGTGHAVACARDLASQSPGLLLILNGDGPLLKPATLEAFLALADSPSLSGAVMSTELPDPTGYGRLLLDSSGNLAAIVEEKAADPVQRAIRTVNTGQYWFRAPIFWNHIDELQPSHPAREFYLTDMVEVLRRHGHAVGYFTVADHTELLGINTRLELSVADRILRQRKLEQLMLSGVTIERPETVTIDVDVEAGPDTLIEPHVSLRGSTRIGIECHIGAGAVLSDCQIADRVRIFPYVVAEQATIGAASDVGPFARLRKDAVLSEHCHIGNFVELKNTTMHRGAKASHLAYLGDASIGEATNIGAGTITCNYDGIRKHRTQIGDHAFVGSNSTLVAPLTIGAGAYVAAGSVITENVAEDALAVGRARQIPDKPLWAKKRRDQYKKTEPKS